MSVEEDPSTKESVVLADEQKKEEQVLEDGGGGASKSEVKMAQPTPMDETRRSLIQVTQFIRFTLRGYFGELFANKWGFFVDRNMSTEIHSYLDWVDYPMGNHVLLGHSDRVWCAAISRDGCYVYSGESDHRIIKWDLRNNGLVSQFKAHSSAVLCLAHSPGLLVSADELGKIKLWDSEHLSLNFTLDGHTAEVTTLSIDTRGTLLVSGSNDKTCRLWSLKSGECIRVMIGHTDRVMAVLFAGDIIVSGSHDESIRLWSAESGTELRRNEDGIDSTIDDLSLNCDSSALACCFDGGFTLFEWPSMEVMRTVEMNALCCSFHPSNPSILAVSDDDDDSIKLIRTDTSEITRTLLGHSDTLRSLAFSPDGYRLISVADDQTVRVWDL